MQKPFDALNNIRIRSSWLFVFGARPAPPILGAAPCNADHGHDLHPSTNGPQRDWPRWRGVNYDGISTERDWQTSWPSHGPEKLWQTDIGIGFSSFSVVSNRLFTMGSIEESKPAETKPAETDPQQQTDDTETSHREVVWCLNVNTGKVLWRHDYPAKLVAYYHEGGPAATPTIHDGLGYALGKGGHLVCLNTKSGDKLWSHNLTEIPGIETPIWGFASSPLIVDSLVIVEAGRTVAFDRMTGDLVWQTELYRPAYSSPILYTDPATGNQFVGSLNNDVLLLLHPKDGSEVARIEFKTPEPTTACTPLIMGNTIFLSSGYNRGCTLFRFQEHQLKVEYDNRNMRNHMNSCVHFNGYLYGFDGNTHSRRNGTIRCIKHDTGELIWKERGYGVGSLLLAGENIIALGDEGELLVIRPSPEKFDLLASAQVITGRCWTPPVLCSGLLYVRNAAGKLICLNLR